MSNLKAGLFVGLLALLLVFPGCVELAEDQPTPTPIPTPKPPSGFADRVKVDVDYDTQREFDGSNQISIAYQGTPASRLQRVEAPHLLSWVGKMPGISAVHIYRLEAAEGGTRVHTEESWAGWLPDADIMTSRMRLFMV